MARVNKRQHYIPQFLLRRFSPPDKPTVRLFVIASGKSVDSAPIKGQCYKDDFYGDDLQLDKYFQEMEGRSAALFRSLDNVKSPLAKIAEEQAGLIVFLLAQLSRTPAAADQTNEWADKFYRETFLRDQIRRENFPAKYADKIKFRFDAPVIASVYMAFESLPFVVDLGISLLKAHESAEFVIGDDPVVECNQAYGPGKGISHTGRAMRGYQALCPISPKQCLFFFDQTIYKVGSPNTFQIPIKAADVAICNGLQVANAHAVLYAGPTTSIDDLKRLFASYKKYRRSDRSAIDRSPFPSMAGRKRELVYGHTIDLKNPVRWSFCGLKRAYRGQGFPNYGPRDPEIKAMSDSLTHNEEMTPENKKTLLEFAMRRAVGRI